MTIITTLLIVILVLAALFDRYYFMRIYKHLIIKQKLNFFKSYIATTKSLFVNAYPKDKEYISYLKTYRISYLLTLILLILLMVFSINLG